MGALAWIDMTDHLEKLPTSSGFSAGNAAFIENLYESYLKNPSSIDDDWRIILDRLPQIDGNQHQQYHGFRVHSYHRHEVESMDSATIGTMTDWGFAENPAYAGILDEGCSIRMSEKGSG